MLDYERAMPSFHLFEVTMIKELMILVILISPCVGISISLGTNNYAGHIDTSTNIKMDLQGEFHEQAIIGTEHFMKIDQGSSSDKCSYMFMASNPYKYSVAFWSNNRNTQWIAGVFDGQTEFMVTSTGG
jgi:hypothetical protein